MPKGLLGKKVGMTQVFDDEGVIIPVTVIELGPCTVLQVRTAERDGYRAVQLGFQDKARGRASKSERGHVALISSKRQKSRQTAGVELPAKADCEPKKHIREFRLDDLPTAEYTVGQVIKADLFAETKYVDVIGTSKGRGFAGPIKRHNFHGMPASHGAKKVHRQMGSTGQRQDPGRVFKGQKMPGHFGHERVTVRRLKVVRVNAEENLLLVRGAIPGHNGGLVMVRETNCYPLVDPVQPTKGKKSK